ncbi:hypothetical protein MTAT_19030 [Moorella thermoacetica]|uniref:Uncharacterized protein n=1 Tax=Neomoorella thermoacetica TaxID=1525 RepID=A0AAC9HJ19_NEOTH|nr:hypothetical protein [Moorella thermoacetica]AOQ24560.1 hypothetical protein Maut_02130 [Moorella thermoacetica]TYL12661.1 hypothetical protein MTAT_19030 [Moorella thermoacetica]
MKAKVILKATLVYDINPDDYPSECDTYVKMLQFDLNTYKDDPIFLLSCTKDIDIRGELIE